MRKRKRHLTQQKQGIRWQLTVLLRNSNKRGEVMKKNKVKQATMGVMAGVLLLGGASVVGAETVQVTGGGIKEYSQVDEEGTYREYLRKMDKETREQEVARVVNRLPYTLHTGQTEIVIPGEVGRYIKVNIDAGSSYGLVTIDPGDYFLIYPFEIERVELREKKGVKLPNKHWARAHAKSVIQKGYIHGDDKGELNLDSTLTGAECMTSLNRVLIDKNIPEIYRNQRMMDEKFPTKHWGAGAVKSVFSRYAYYTLTPETVEEFKYNEPMTREGMANILYNVLKNKEMEREVGQLVEENKPEIVFKDRGQIAEDKQEAIDFCVRAGILIGDDQGRVNPKQAITRAEFMVFLGRIAEVLKTVE